ncbi:unnamed protein product [Porites lobata]|uniref:Transmembrane protein n=1 Tax=Porites lobata TaxID=104759 RepID=A0ABN8P0K8_9CNID|nr:unnamed protein product [Porites lobata]
MATTVNEENEPHETSRDRQSDTESRRNTWLALGRLLLHILCSGYSLSLVWLLAYLKGNSNYWFLSFIPIFFNFSPLLNFLISLWKPTSTVLQFEPSTGVVINLMACFTMLTRVAYYHRQEDEFIGPRFIIISLQASIILVFLDFLQQRDAKLENFLNFKDAMIRMLLDFVDIFNMVEILSRNPCVGVGLYVSENSSTERAIQAFCTLSFFVIMSGLDTKLLEQWRTVRLSDEPPRNDGELMHSGLTVISSLYQNLPFLVIRIVVWAQYRLYSLGFLVKNVTVIILAIAIYYKARWKRTNDIEHGHSNFQGHPTRI